MHVKCKYRRGGKHDQQFGGHTGLQYFDRVFAHWVLFLLSQMLGAQVLFNQIEQKAS